VLNHRTSARVVLLDETGAVLLLCGSDPAAVTFPEGAAPRWWFTVGGEMRPGERLAEAAARELAEETGLRVEPADLVGPVWRRDEVFEFNGALLDSEEFYLVHRTRRFEPSTEGRTELERRYIHGARWCDADDIAELVASCCRWLAHWLTLLVPTAATLPLVASGRRCRFVDQSKTRLSPTTRLKPGVLPEKNERSR
jgi:8-oxo-dGTP pyrophosphatase MutT (NUDIX family)